MSLRKDTSDLIKKLGIVLKRFKNPAELISDIYHINIKGMHKHDYQNVEDVSLYGYHWQRHQCTHCEKTLSLDKHQMDNLPASMIYGY